MKSMRRKKSNFDQDEVDNVRVTIMENNHIGPNNWSLTKPIINDSMGIFADP